MRRPIEHQILFKAKGFTAEMCIEPESLRTAFQLRYRAYLKAGAIAPNDSQLVQDQYDLAENSRIHLIWFDGKPIASVRGCIWSDRYDWGKIEAVEHFRPEITQQFGITSRLLESTRYVVDPEFQGRKSLFAQILMFRIHALNSAIHGCQHIVTAVQAKHAPFYKRMLNFDPISEAKTVEWIDYDQIVLMSTPREKSLETALDRGMPPYTEEELARYAMCWERMRWHQLAA